MANLSLEVGAWAEQQFSQCELGDRRRTRRLVKTAMQAALKPDASTPEQAERWSDCKAAYHLFDQEDVTFDAIIAPHCAASRQVAAGVWLVLNDATELNFGYLREIEGIGRVGSMANRGFFLHTALLVRPDGRELRGVAAQELYTRSLKKIPRVSAAVRKQRTTRETDVWGRVIDAVGPPPGAARFIHVCDRGADDFDVYCHLLAQDCGWVIRAAQLGRKVYDRDERELRLDELLAAAPTLGSYTLAVRAQPGRAARTAELEVRAAQFAMPRPKSGASRYAREQGVERIAMWALEVREVSATPAGVEPLRWVLLTSEPATSFTAAWRTIEYYERRPLIEEYHKCLKTGCRIEARQYRDGRSVGSGDRLGEHPVGAALAIEADGRAGARPTGDGRGAATLDPSLTTRAATTAADQDRPRFHPRPGAPRRLPRPHGRRRTRLADHLARPRHPPPMPPRSRSHANELWVMVSPLRWDQPRGSVKEANFPTRRRDLRQLHI